jgi:hypothetical protein
MNDYVEQFMSEVDQREDIVSKAATAAESESGRLVGGNEGEGGLRREGMGAGLRRDGWEPGSGGKEWGQGSGEMGWGQGSRGKE